MAGWVWLISLLGSLAAALAAVAAWRSAKATRKTSLAQILMEITRRYGLEKMYESLHNLSWHREYTPDSVKAFEEKTLNSATWRQADRDRRRVAHHFHQLRLLLDRDLISKTDLKAVVPRMQVDFLLDVIEPLEKAKGEGYDSTTYDTFRRLYGGSQKKASEL